jgi:hypothetical protein
MEVHSRPFLVLRNAGEGQPGVRREKRLCEANRRGELAPDADDEAVPELACVSVPEDVCRVVVAVDAEGLADEGIVCVVGGAAAEGPTVLAPSAVATRAAAFSSAMYGPERWGGEGDEEPGSVADRGGDVLAAEEARADEVEGVARVESGAGGADGRASVAAADEEPFAGFVAGVVVVEDFAGCRVVCRRRSGQVDRVGTAARGRDLV